MEGEKHRLAVGAVDEFNQVADFSSRGPTADGRIKPEVVARGVLTYTAMPFSSGLEYWWNNGTSFACPLVGGAAALLLQAHPEWTPWDVRAAFLSSADNAPKPNNERGWGLVDTWSARSLGERRLKRSPLRDVAGMLRSFEYAAHHGLVGEGRDAALRAREVAWLLPWARAWAHWVGTAFLRGYLPAVREADLVPRDPAQLALLLRVLLIEKAVYELGYEIDPWSNLALTFAPVIHNDFHFSPYFFQFEQTFGPAIRLYLKQHWVVYFEPGFIGWNVWTDFDRNSGAWVSVRGGVGFAYKF